MQVSLRNSKELEQSVIDKIEEVYMTSFPANERIPFEYLVMKTDYFEINGMLAVFCDDKFAGMLSYIKEQKYVFIMYFAICEEMRSGGIGKWALHLFHTTFKDVIYIYEIDKPVDEQTKRRISFYESLGCVMNDYVYLLPPLQEGNAPFPMLLGSYPLGISESEYADIKYILYHKIYRIE
ncbi:MAG: hypothetical protein LBO69_05055 [Ignavibacteria bacterium]|jgi:hypothetical protein|nr:hypothetical protein [Ignavibacteria bacterium]